jgi:hypothetical protein
MRALLVLLSLWCVYTSASAAPIEYIFTGEISGFTKPQLFSATQVTLTNAPFTVSIVADTSNIQHGYSFQSVIASEATWTVDGIGTATTTSAGVAIIGMIGGGLEFAWNTTSFASPTGNGDAVFTFSGNILGSVNPLSNYSVPSKVSLLTKLVDNSRLPPYPIRITWPNIGSLTVTSLTNTQFSATPVPEANSYALMLAGLGLMGFITRRKQTQAA